MQVTVALDNRSGVPVKSIEVRGWLRVQGLLPSKALSSCLAGRQAACSRPPHACGQGDRLSGQRSDAALSCTLLAPGRGPTAKSFQCPDPHPELKPLAFLCHVQVGLERDIMLQEEPGCVASQHGFRELCSKHATAAGVPAGAAAERWAPRPWVAAAVARQVDGAITAWLARVQGLQSQPIHDVFYSCSTQDEP